ncbi:putative reverse transcriptase domain-containing protein [Tanacetum coccineum]
MVGAGHAAYTDRFHKLARLVPHLVTPETKKIERYIYGLALQIYRMVAATEPRIIQSAILKAGVLTDEAVRNESLKRNGGESSKEGNAKGDNKRARTGKVFATITNPVRKEYAGSAPRCTYCNLHHNPETPCRMCTNCNRLGNFTRDCRTRPRMVNPLNARNPTADLGACYECGGTDHYKSACPRLNRAPGQGGNRPNKAMAIEGGQGHGNNGNPACGRAFVIGSEEARQDPNIMTGMFSLNNHCAMILFDYGGDYNFVSTTFMSLLDIKPSSLGFSYEIEIASGQLVEINKVIRGCKLEIEGHTFDIDLIPFGHGSFDVIIGMDLLSGHRAKIVCHERVVRIPLPNGEMLRVYGERTEEKVKHLMSAKVEEPKLEDIAIVQNFSESPYRLAPTKNGGVVEPTQRTSGQGFYSTKFIAMGSTVNSDGIHVDPNKIEAVKNWEAPKSPIEVRSFLGLAGYYRRSIANFSKIAKSLTILTQKNKKYIWGDEKEMAFQTLNDKLCNAPVLALLDGPKDFGLKIHKKNYTTHDLKLGAVVFALKIWRHYSYGTKSVIYTDHKSLQHIFNQKELNMRQRRWIELFSDCDCEIRYHPGKANVVADALSRKERIKPRRVQAMNITIQLSIKDEQIERRSDEALYYMDRIWVPLTGDVRTSIMDKAHKSRYSVYPGADKMYYDLRDIKWWPGMKKDIALYDFKMDRLARLYLNEVIERHDLGIHAQSMGHQFKGGWDVHLPLVEFFYNNNNYHSRVRCAPFEALFGRKCCSPILWAEIGEGELIGPEIEERKLAPRFVEPFEITERIDPIAYRLTLPQELSNVHDTFHMSNLKKCLADPTLHVPLKEIQVNARLNFVEEPVEILEHEFKKLKRSRIPIVKVRWNSK